MAGWLVGRYGPIHVVVAGLILAATGLAEEAVSVAELWALACAVFVAGIATVVPALLTLIGSRAGSNRGRALGLAGLALSAGASCGPLAASHGA